MIAFKWSAGAASGTMPAYDDGSTPTLVTEKPPAVAFVGEYGGNTNMGIMDECSPTIVANHQTHVFTQFGEDLAGTLTARYDSSPCTDRGQNVVAAPAIVLKVRGGADTYMKRDGKVGTAGKGALTSEEVTFTVAATQDQTLFAPVDFRHGTVGEPASTLAAKSTGGYSLNYQPGCTDGYIVRRLTPIECERLQGFPDGWTDLTGCDADAVAEKVAASLHYDERQKAALLRKVRKWSKECPDGSRYKACGNSMAVPNMRWLFERLQAYDTMRETEVLLNG